MKKLFVLLVSLVLLPSLLIAVTLEEKRRVEEKKRGDLRSSEIQIAPEKKAPPPPIAPIDLTYFVELMPRRVTYRYDACKVLVILMGVEDEYIDLNSQVNFLKEKTLIPKKLESEFDPMKPLRKGLAAYMFYKALGIKGGLCLRLFGVNERYAVKELGFQGIMPSGNVNDIVSGEELVSVFTQATNYMTKKKKGLE